MNVFNKRTWLVAFCVPLVLVLESCESGNKNAGVVIDPQNQTEVEVEESVTPNILLVITDDQGLDASAQYSFSNDLPNTPTVDALAASGIVYDNAWATPSCTTTRAALLTGLHGVNSGVTSTPAVLPASVGTIQSYLAEQANSANYASGVFGKWHVAGAGNPDPNHPQSVGVGSHDQW